MRSLFDGFPTADREPWVADAVCPPVDPELFFPEAGIRARDAKAICRECPVRVDCLAYAVGHEIRHGVWGGLSERERRDLRRGKGAA